MIDTAERLIAGGDQRFERSVALIDAFCHCRHDQLAGQLAQAGHSVAGIGNGLSEMCAHDGAGT